MTRAIKSDLDGDGRAEISITSPWGLGVLALSDGALSSTIAVANGTRLGDWALDTRSDRVDLVADLDGDGRCELFVTNPRGVAALQLQGDALAALAMAPNGATLGGWRLQTLGDNFGPALDLDGDGRAELFVASARGVGVLALARGELVATAVAENGAQLGGWSLDTATDRFSSAGDLDGDGAAELLVTGPRGLAVLELCGHALSTALYVANGTDLGGWIYDSAHNHVVAAVDLDGDGRSELLIASRQGLGIFKRLPDGALMRMLHVPNGARLGEWTLDTRTDRIGPAADLDGDGRPELLVTSPAGLGILKLSAGALTTIAFATNGAQLGAWPLHTARNHICGVADFDADGRAELLVTSRSGLGVLALAGGLTALTTAPNGAQLGAWRLDTTRDRVEPG